jgi:hypothetical protein
MNILINKIKKEGKSVFFKNLPIEAKKSLIQWMAIEGSAWSDEISINKITSEPISELLWNLFIEQIETSRGWEEFFYVELPTSFVTNHIMKYHDEISEDHKSWEEYHAWYVDSTLETHSKTNRWHCIPYSDEECIIDGWHRLHSYIRNNDKTIPFVY